MLNQACMIVLLWNTKEDILKTMLVTLFPSVAMKEAFKLQKDVKVVNCNVSIVEVVWSHVMQ